MSNLVEDIRRHASNGSVRGAIPAQDVRAAADEIEQLRGLLTSAKRYVAGYQENERNHPQARDIAKRLVAQINEALR